MILDTSAIVAILFREPEADALLERLRLAEVRGVGTATLAATGIVVTARAGDAALAWVHRFLQAFDIFVIPFDAAHWQEAVAAYSVYGRGRHPAGLRFGDCLTYATAKLAGDPFLCLGDDFRRTDLEIA
jgi:ribonuclease VapC